MKRSFKFNAHNNSNVIRNFYHRNKALKRSLLGFILQSSNPPPIYVDGVRGPDRGNENQDQNKNQANPCQVQ